MVGEHMNKTQTNTSSSGNSSEESENLNASWDCLMGAMRVSRLLEDIDICVQMVNCLEEQGAQ